MSRRSPGPCVVCGATTRIERNHVAARANDRSLRVPLCKGCHDVFTDWQWALGVLRRESLDERRSHGAREGLWALCQGFALLALLGGPPGHAEAWVTLARAAGTALRIREEGAGLVPRWGPRPARGRRSRSLPVATGSGDPRRILVGLSEALPRWLADDPAGPTVQANVLALVGTSQPSEEVPSEWHPAVEMLTETLRSLAAASGPAELDAAREGGERTLVAIRDVLATAARWDAE